MFLLFNALISAALLPACAAFSPSLNSGDQQQRPFSAFSQQLNAKIKVKRGDESFNLDYEITNPDLKKPPLVVLHGGPGLVRDYLLPLQELVTDRPILFHDQLGSGLSERPCDLSLYSIDGSVDDLVALLDEVKFDKFHLYGQSYGGILAFEYLKKVRPDNCLSVTLSSAPSSIPRMHDEWDRLIEYISETTPEFLVEEAFRRVHVCRKVEVPEVLRKSYADSSSVWDGVDMIPDYEISVTKKLESPPALATRGEYDFVTDECLSDWSDCFANIETEELWDCSHHGLLEKPGVYGDVLNTFIAKHDV